MFQGFLDAYNADPARSANMIGLAIRGGQPLVSNDVAGDARIPNRAALTANGNYALALLPISVDKRVVSVLILRARETGAFNDDETRLLVELVSNLSFALELMENRRRIEYLAYHDDLTGLANRSLFHERLRESIAYARESGRKIALVLIDIERFKNINDTLGRQGGDALLTKFAARLSGNAAGKAHAAAPAEGAEDAGRHAFARRGHAERAPEHAHRGPLPWGLAGAWARGDHPDPEVRRA